MSQDTSHIENQHHVGDTLVFENDRVRIWSLELKPGAESHSHVHPHDYVMVCIEGDRIAAQATDGPEHPYGPNAGNYVDIPTQPGHAVFVDKGVTETAINSGETTYRNLVIELL